MASKEDAAPLHAWRWRRMEEDAKEEKIIIQSVEEGVSDLFSIFF